MDSLVPGGGVLLILFAVVLAVLWTLLPFAIFGTKKILNEILLETREKNRRITSLSKEIKNMSSGAEETPETDRETSDNRLSALYTHPNQSGGYCTQCGEKINS